MLPASVAIGAEKTAKPTTEASAKDTPFPLSGLVELRLRWRGADHEGDLDISGMLELNWGDPRTDLFTASLSAWGVADLDGDRDTYGRFLFDSPYETYDNALHGTVHHAYFDLNRLWLFDRVRAGRQVVHSAETVRIDGLFVKTTDLLPGDGKLLANLFAGLPVHFWESSPWGDLAAGGGIEYRPCRSLKTNLDFLWLRDRSDLWGLARTTRSTLASLSASWRPVQALSLFAKLSLLNEPASDLALQPAEFTFSGKGKVPGPELWIHGLLTTRLVPWRDPVAELNSFDAVLGRANRFTRARVTVVQPLGEGFEAEVGGSFYDVYAFADQDDYDRDTLSLWASVRTHDLFVKGLALGATAETTDPQGFASRRGFHGEAAYTYREMRDKKSVRYMEITMGGGIAPYAYTRNGTELREQVLTFFVRGRWWPMQGFQLCLEFRSENDEFDAYYEVRLRVGYRF